jgi:YHS domain-containing protein
MRAAFLLVWLAAAVAVLLPLVRRPFPGSSPRTDERQRDELVKDPVCGTYVVRSRAVTHDEGGAPRYFCSTDCARRYLSGV